MEPDKRELKLKLKNLTLHLDDRGHVLSKSLLEVLYVEKSKVPIIFQNLLDNGIDTWRKLQDADTLEQTIGVIGGDEVNGKNIWNAKVDYNNSFVVSYLGLRRIGTTELKKAPVFEETEVFRSNENELRFVQPSNFEEMLKSIESYMDTRNICPLVCVGPLGSGTTRCGIELVKAVAASSSEVVWKRGHVSARFLPHCTKQDTIGTHNCVSVLELALCYGFGLQPFKAAGYIMDWRGIRDKLQADFGVNEVRVLLHVDDFDQNPYAVQMLTEACNYLWGGWSDDLKVVPVITGFPLRKNLPEYRSGYYILEPLPTDQLSVAFAERIGMKQNLLEKCPNLQNLLTVCEGLPALIACLALNILRLDESRLRQLRENGILDIADARAIYNELANYVEERYALDEWRLVLFDKVPSLQKEDCEQILTNLLVDVLIGAYVRFSDPVARNVDPQVTYEFVEGSGLISFNRTRTVEVGHSVSLGTAQINMPMIALSAMNRYLKVIDEAVFNYNPFDSVFECHEQLALAGLQAAVKLMHKNRDYRAGSGANILTSWFLRRGALEVENFEMHDRPVLLIPDSCNAFKVRQLFNGKEVDLRTVKTDQVEALNSRNKAESIGKTVPTNGGRDFPGEQTKVVPEHPNRVSDGKKDKLDPHDSQDPARTQKCLSETVSKHSHHGIDRKKDGVDPCNRNPGGNRLKKQKKLSKIMSRRVNHVFNRKMDNANLRRLIKRNQKKPSITIDQLESVEKRVNSERSQSRTLIDKSEFERVSKTQAFDKSASVEEDPLQNQSKRCRATSEEEGQVDDGSENATEKGESDTSFNGVDEEKEGEEKLPNENNDEGKNWIQATSTHSREMAQDLGHEKVNEPFNGQVKSESTIQINNDNGVNNEDEIPKPIPGTILVSTAENEAIDGVALFRGQLKDDIACWVLVLSRSEWSQPINSQGEKVVLPFQERSQSINDLIRKMSSKKDEIVQNWFGNNVIDPVFVILDIITNCASKHTLYEDDIELPEDVCSCFVTTFDNVEKVLRPALGVRARMKWVVD